MLRIGSEESFWDWPTDDLIVYDELEGGETQNTEESTTVLLRGANEGLNHGKWERKYEVESAALMMSRMWGEGGREGVPQWLG